MRKFILAILIFVSLILQLTVFNYIKVAGVKPDLILAIVIFNALINGSKEGAILGLVAGLAQDMMTGQFYGMNALSKMITGYIFGFAGRKLYRENILIPILCLFFGSVINESILFFLTYFIDLRISLIKAIQDKILPMAIYNSCLAPFIYSKFYDSSAKGLLSKVER